MIALADSAGHHAMLVAAFRALPASTPTADLQRELGRGWLVGAKGLRSAGGPLEAIVINTRTGLWLADLDGLRRVRRDGPEMARAVPRRLVVDVTPATLARAWGKWQEGARDVKASPAPWVPSGVPAAVRFAAELLAMVAA